MRTGSYVYLTVGILFFTTPLAAENNPDISGYDYQKKLVRNGDRMEGEIAPPDHPLWKVSGCSPANNQVLKIRRNPQGDTPVGCEIWFHNPTLTEPDWENKIRIDLPNGGVGFTEKVGRSDFTPEYLEQERAASAKRLEAAVRELGGRTQPPSKKTNDEINEDIYGRKEYRRMKRHRSYSPENMIPGRVYAKGSKRPLPIPTKEFYTPEQKKKQQEIIANLVDEPTPLTDEEKARGVTIPYDEFYNGTVK
jgi:hypothetical protein